MRGHSYLSTGGRIPRTPWRSKLRSIKSSDSAKQPFGCFFSWPQAVYPPGAVSPGLPGAASCAPLRAPIQPSSHSAAFFRGPWQSIHWGEFSPNPSRRTLRVLLRSFDTTCVCDFQFRVKTPTFFTPQALKMPSRVKMVPFFTPFFCS